MTYSIILLEIDIAVFTLLSFIFFLFNIVAKLENRLIVCRNMFIIAKAGYSSYIFFYNISASNLRKFRIISNISIKAISIKFNIGGKQLKLQHP